MVDYYRALVAGEGRGEGLRRAQLGMLAEPARSHPYYWASFILSGRWDSIDAGAPAPVAGSITVVLTWAKSEKKARLEVSGDGIGDGARAVVDGGEAFALEPSKDGGWVVKKGAKSTPGGLT